MCWRIDCPFKERDASAGAEPDEEVINILIFGITGMTGGAVMDAALGCGWFRVKGVTRMMSGPMYDNLQYKGVKLYTGDMNIPQTLVHAMKNIDTVFLVTTYWDSKSVDTEFKQGVNVVNVAIASEVKHLIYVGTDYSVNKATERCKYLEGKALVEDYIVSIGIPFTVVHLGFYFENFVSVFKPIKNRRDQYAIALPMGTKTLNCGSMLDFGHCIGMIALSPGNYLNKTLKLATAYMTVSDFVDAFNQHFTQHQLYNPWITITQYRELDFEDTEELASMFVHYSSTEAWDTGDMHRMYPECRTFKQWLQDNDTVCRKVIFEENIQTLEVGTTTFKGKDLSKEIEPLSRRGALVVQTSSSTLLSSNPSSTDLDQVVKKFLKLRK